MKIINVPIGKLTPYANNSRTHSQEQVQQIIDSILEFGFTNPILIDEHNMIIAGHGRLLAAAEIKIEKIPCVRLSGLTDDQKRAYVIADNKLALNAGWDEEKLRLELFELQENDFNLDLTGFSVQELDIILDIATDEKDGLTDDDEIPEIPAEAVTKPGDVWVLGDHRLFCGDSTLIASYKFLLGTEKADMLLTDPPYNIDYKGGSKEREKISNDSMASADFLEFLIGCWVNCNQYMAPGAVFYIWHAHTESLEFHGACKASDWAIRECLVWVKNNSNFGRQDYHWKHEPCLYGWKSGAAHKWNSDRKQTTVLEFDRPTTSNSHPTMKPVDLIMYQMKNSSDKGDIILDVFGGSGTTLIAAEKIGRKARLIEIDPKYCDVIIKRWQDFTGQYAINDETGNKFSEVK